MKLNSLVVLHCNNFKFSRESRLSDLRQHAHESTLNETEQQRLLQLSCMRACSNNLYCRHDRLASVQQNTHQRLIQENEEQRYMHFDHNTN